LLSHHRDAVDAAALHKEGRSGHDDRQCDQAAKTNRDERVHAGIGERFVGRDAARPFFPDRAGVKKQVVGNDGRTDQGKDRHERPRRDTRHEHACEHGAQVGTDDDRRRQEHDAHEPNQRYQYALDPPVRTKAQQRTRGRPHNQGPDPVRHVGQRLKANGGTRDVPRLEGSIAEADGGQDQDDARSPNEPIGERRSQRLAEPLPANQSQPGGHLLQDDGRDDREDNRPE